MLKDNKDLSREEVVKRVIRNWKIASKSKAFYTNDWRASWTIGDK